MENITFNVHIVDVLEESQKVYFVQLAVIQIYKLFIHGSMFSNPQ